MKDLNATTSENNNQKNVYNERAYFNEIFNELATKYIIKILKCTCTFMNLRIAVLAEL